MKLTFFPCLFAIFRDLFKSKKEKMKQIFLIEISQKGNLPFGIRSQSIMKLSEKPLDS